MKQNPLAESTDELLRLVADHRRRAIVNHLRENGGSAVSVGELVDSVPRDPSPSVDDRTDADRLALQLRHVHLPKLADAGIVHYDAGSETVRYRPQDRDRLEKLLRFLAEEL